MSKGHESDKPAPDTQRYYDTFAASGWYDTDAETAGWPAALQALMARTFEVKPASDARSVLDLGAGTGMTIAAIKQHVQPERLVAVDISEKMLELLRQKDIAEGVETVADSAQHYAASCDEKFDLITSFSALEFVPNLPMALRDTAQLLNQGGVLAFTYVAQGEGEPPEKLIDSTDTIGSTAFQYHWPPEEIEQALTESGLVIVDRLDDATPDVRGLDYSFLVAQRQ